MQELGSWIKTEMKAKNHSELAKYVLAFRVLQSETMKARGSKWQTLK